MPVIPILQRGNRGTEVKDLPEIIEIIDAGASIWFLRLGPPPLNQAEEGSLLQAVCANAQVPNSRTHLGTADGGEAGESAE